MELVARYAPPALPGVASWNATPSPPLSKLATAIFPGIGAAVPVYGGALGVGVNSIDVMLPTAPDDPALSITSRAICRPALSVTAAVTLCHACHDPVAGIVSGPDTSVPFISRWNVPPGPSDATRNITR